LFIIKKVKGDDFMKFKRGFMLFAAILIMSTSVFCTISFSDGDIISDITSGPWIDQQISEVTPGPWDPDCSVVIFPIV